MAKIYPLMKKESKADRGSPLGLFSYLVMASIPKLKHNAFGLRITEYLIDELKTLIDPGQVYLTLKRLEGRHLIRKDVLRREAAGDVSVYTVTKSGEQALAATHRYIQVAVKISRGPHEEARKISKLSRAG